MERKSIFIFLMGIMLSLCLFISGCTTNGNNNSSNGALYTDTISCIANNSEVYIMQGCTACALQANLFGEDFNNLNVIDCTQEPQKCVDADILSVPTWIIKGERYYGVQRVAKIMDLAGCE